MTKETLIRYLAPIFVMLSFIRDIRLISRIAGIGNVVYVAGFVIILQYVFRDTLNVQSLQLVTETVAEWPRAIAVVVVRNRLFLPRRVDDKRREVPR